MRALLLSSFTMILIWSCKVDNNNGFTATEMKPVAENPVLVAEKFEDLNHIFNSDSDTTYVINFWSTTCPPCIEEMPYFEGLSKKYEDEKLKIVLISLNMKRDLESRVKPFIMKHGITNEVILLADQNYNIWTAAVDSSWFGALPATLIHNSKTRKFSFGAFSDFHDLEKRVLPALALME
ncbi:MAG: TlpA family protein disulfide reductase [Bacteroidia bacterium]|nr:TlpA family protein disulfide reductase [Bacteroidia bacterium]